VFPIVVELRERPKRTRAPELLFVGGFIHPPNEDGICWFVREVWPDVRDAVPDATLTIVGSHASAEVLALERCAGVRVVGYVPDTAPYLDRAAVSIAPLRYGSGMKGKVVEALACGVPVVTTSAGAQGLEVRAGVDLEVADQPQAFAHAVVALLQNPVLAEAMGLAGQKVAARLCDPDRIEQSLQEMIRRLAPDGSAAGQDLGWIASAPSRLWKIAGRRLSRLLSNRAAASHGERSQ